MKDYYAPMHSAEHILNQTMLRMFQCERSFNNHIERKKSKCDYHFGRDLTLEEIKKIEEKVNEIIDNEVPITEEFISIETAKEKYNLERLPEHTSDTLRLIHIGNYDSCLCIGKHVDNTKEIDTFKIISSTYENNVLRIRFKLIKN